MSNISEWFGFGGSTPEPELPEIFPLPVSSTDFVKTDITSIYSKILTDTLERTHGLSDDQIALMWDSCVKTNASDGLITLLSKAMADKKDLFLVYDKSVQVIRVATKDEQEAIRKDYETKAESSVGVFISFSSFTRSDMIKFYIGIEYYTVASMYKSMNLSKAIQIKINDLRSSVSLSDKAEAKSQAQNIATALGNGKDVLLDAKDSIENSKPDLTAIQESVSFVVKKLSFYLGLPDSYIIGEQTSGMGTTGENDMRAVERGLKSYYFSILKPTLETLLGVSVTYKSQDFRQIASSTEILKTFSLIDDTLVSADNKRMIINKLLDLPEDAKGDAPKKIEAVPPPFKPNAQVVN